MQTNSRIGAAQNTLPPTIWLSQKRAKFAGQKADISKWKNEVPVLAVYLLARHTAGKFPAAVVITTIARIYPLSGHTSLFTIRLLCVSLSSRF
jgi:hypothetical protein